MGAMLRRDTVRSRLVPPEQGSTPMTIQRAVLLASVVLLGALFKDLVVPPECLEEWIGRLLGAGAQQAGEDGPHHPS